MIKRKAFVILLLLFCFKSISQSKTDSLSLTFKTIFNKLPLELHKQYTTSNNDTIVLETFRCYISNIVIQYTDKSVYVQKDSYHLLDLENPNSLIIPITAKRDIAVAKVTFNIGIDSLTNNAGALTGDLDPTKGMYWAWQSGYINMKIEGKSSSCKNRKNEFQFHIGGYLYPNYAMREMKFNWNKKATKLDVAIDLNDFFSNIKLSEINSVMIPGKKAMQLADNSVKMFHLE